MKQLLFAFLLTFSLTSAYAKDHEEKITLDSLHGQLIKLIENEAAQYQKLDPDTAAKIKLMIPLWRSSPSRTSIEDRIKNLKSALNQNHTSEKTREAANLCMSQMSDLMQKLSKQMLEDIRKMSEDSMVRVMNATEPEEIAKIIYEYIDYRRKVEEKYIRDDSATTVDPETVKGLMEYYLRFHNYRLSNQMSNAAGQITQIEELSFKFLTVVHADAFTKSLEFMRKSIGMLPPKELEALWHTTFHQLLDDANQDRLDEIMQKVRERYKMSMAYKATEIQAASWQWLDMLVRQLKNSVQCSRYGASPKFNADDLIRSDAYYGLRVKPEEFLDLLNRYMIRVEKDKDQETSVRLFYNMTDLKTATDQLQVRVLDDANQDQLDSLLDEIKKLRPYASENRYIGESSLVTKLDSLAQLARGMKQNVSVLKSGGNNQQYLQQLCNNHSYGETLLSKQELLEKLKRYQVTVETKNGNPMKRALFVDAEELLQQVKSYSELPAMIPELTRAASNGIKENDTQIFLGLMPRINRCAEIAQQLSTGEAFTVRHDSSTHYFNADPSRLTPASNPSVQRIQQLEAAVEWSVILRFFPQEAPSDPDNHESSVKKLMTKFHKEKNYEAMSRIHGVSQCFKPTRQLLSLKQALAIRDYLNGVRQQDIFDQPRLAVYYLQRAAISTTTVIDAQEIKTRLQSLRSKFPADYEKGIDDIHKSSTHGTLPEEIEIPARTD